MGQGTVSALTLRIWISRLTIFTLSTQSRFSILLYLYHLCFLSSFFHAPTFCTSALSISAFLQKSHLRTLSGSVCHPYPWEIINNMGVRAGFIPTPALPEDEQLWKCSKSYWNGPPAAGDDSDLWAVWRRGAKVTGGPPLLLTGAAHMEDIPEMKRQGLISRAEVWDTSVIIEQRSAEKKSQIYSH